jgi:hypothetical protein
MFEKITLGSPSPLEGSEAKNCKIRRHPALGLEHSLFVRGTSQVDYVSFAIARIFLQSRAAQAAFYCQTRIHAF